MYKLEKKRNSRPYLSLTLICSLVGSPVLAECNREIVLISESAEYIVIDELDTFRISEVGNLWWLGIRSIEGVAENSSKKFSGFISRDLVDVATGLRFGDSSDRIRSRSLYLLENLGRDLSSQSELTHYQLEDSEIVRWINFVEEGTLLTSVRENDGKVFSHISSDLEMIAQWTVSDRSLGMSVCGYDNKFVITGLDNSYVIDDDSSQAVEYDFLNRTDGYRLTRQSFGCKFLSTKVNGSNDQLMDTRLVDLSNNEIGPEFVRSRNPRTLLVGSGSKLLQQLITTTPAPGSDAEFEYPTNQFRIIDTNDGNILESQELQVQNGELLIQSYCQGDDERAIVRTENMLFTIDVNNLTVTGAFEVPFDRNYILF